MSDKPPRPSARRRSILVYPVAKDRFDEVHRELRSDGATQTLLRLLDDRNDLLHKDGAESLQLPEVRGRA